MPATAAAAAAETELDALYERARALPPEIQEELALRLLAALDGEEVSEAEAEAAWGEEIARRVRDIDEGRVEGIPAEEVFARAREILRDG